MPALEVLVHAHDIDNGGDKRWVWTLVGTDRDITARAPQRRGHDIGDDPVGLGDIMERVLHEAVIAANVGLVSTSENLRPKSDVNNSNLY
jgi:hypothetical protein